MYSRRAFLAAPLFARSAFAGQVRIRSVDIYSLRLPVTKDEAAAGLMHTYNVVEIGTDAGVKGYSFAGPGAAQLPAIRELLVGKDLFAIEKHLADGLEKWGGVEHALWDAIGRIAKQPVYRMLGGGSSRVRAYITCVWPGKADQQHVSYREQAEQALRLQKAGFRGMKIRAWRPNPLDDADACAEIREATGKDFAIMFDRTAHLPQIVGQPVWSFDTGLKVGIEHGVAAETIAELRARGHDMPQADRWSTDFGRAQLIYKMEDGYFAASERRTDGQAVGF